MIGEKERSIKLKTLQLKAEEILADYRIAYKSRQASLLGRREVMGGKAKFGIFGDGKEVAQVAMARQFAKGDFRAGYYRDQTFMFAIGATTISQFFAQLYAHADLEAEPGTGGRGMSSHFATRFLDENGHWKDLTKMYNSSADVSPTGSQMPRLVGLAYASRLYRELDSLKKFKQFSRGGREIAFGAIGNASCAEGMFWEAVNAVGVLQAPLLLSIWDDGYGISVPNEYQITKADVSQVLAGFQRQKGGKPGYEIFRVKGWDYPALMETYARAARTVREEHVPAIIHVVEVTQPQGHSTSGSHERYKSKERLQWETEFDCIRKMRLWMIKNDLFSAEELDEIEAKDRAEVESIRNQAWKAYSEPIRAEVAEVLAFINEALAGSANAGELREIRKSLAAIPNPLRRDTMVAVQKTLIAIRGENLPVQPKIVEWKAAQDKLNAERYHSCLYSETDDSALKVPVIEPEYSDDAPAINGFEVLNACFDVALARDPRVIAFGEDVGKLGDVNQGFRGLQEKYGELRVADTGIRECTIIGQAIGMAMRGLRPIAEVQYLDYLLYALQIMSDDLATVRWRTRGGQKAPVIIRTRGHRLEGVWHSGSLMSGIMNLLRGIYILVPRNMTQAAGFYNTLLRAEEPALIVEVLNAYRQKEKLPRNIGEFTVPLGQPEILREGTDVTLVTYGACCPISLAAAERLNRLGVSVEVVDIQTLMPFDLAGRVGQSLQKTNRIVFVDEDVPGGTSAYMMREVLENQDGYRWLDSAPLTIPGQPHRPAYGSDGDYWSKPNVEEIVEKIYRMMNEVNPEKYPIFF